MSLTHWFFIGCKEISDPIKSKKAFIFTGSLYFLTSQLIMIDKKEENSKEVFFN